MWLPGRPTESSTWWKASELVNRKCIILYQDNPRLPVSLLTRQNCYSLAGKFWFICCVHQRLYLQISIYFDLYKILLMGRSFNSLKIVKDCTVLCSKRWKVLGRWNYEVAWKIAEDSETKCLVNTLFSRVLGDNDKCVFCFYFKTKGTFFANPVEINSSQTFV